VDREDLRIPFEVAISEPRLLKPRFGELSLAQQTVLKSIYGLPLSADRVDAAGFSEVDHYWATQGYGTYDELGYLTQVNRPALTYVPREYPEAWMVSGIRAGKSEIAAFISTYESTCGGHEAYTRKGKRVIWFQIAQDLGQAQYSLHAIRANLDSMGFMKGRIQAVTARRIDLWNGMTVATNPPTIRSVRGYDSPGAVMDEVAVWWQEAESANPDYEIYNQLLSRQAQFRFPKIVGISSPWNKAGLLYQRHEAGTDGARLVCESCRGSEAGPSPDCAACDVLRHPHQGRLILYASTAQLVNPDPAKAHVTRDFLVSAQRKDPRAFERECLARFQDSLSGFLDSTLLRQAVDVGCMGRPPEPRNFYVAAIDPAFRRDAFGFCIAHADPDKGIVIDYLDRALPQPGEKIDPTKRMAEVATICRRYKVMEVLTDQFSIEALKQIGQGHGLALREVPFTGKSKAAIYANLQQLLNTGRLRLLDHPETLRELLMLERQNLQGGQTKIAAPRDEHDDMATVVALACHAAVWMLPSREMPTTPEPTTQQLCREQVERKRRYVAVTDFYE
jgi:hypothetical protein